MNAIDKDTAKWLGVVWFGKALLICAFIQQLYVESLPYAGTVLTTSAGTKVFPICAPRGAVGSWGGTGDTQSGCCLA